MADFSHADNIPAQKKHSLCDAGETDILGNLKPERKDFKKQEHTLWKEVGS